MTEQKKILYGVFGGAILLHVLILASKWFAIGLVVAAMLVLLFALWKATTGGRVSMGAALLGAFLEEKEGYVRDQLRQQFGLERERVRFDVVAHSMGGLVLRYYLRYGGEVLRPDGAAPPLTWAGADAVDHVIFCGTPNAGSINSIRWVRRRASVPCASASIRRR